MSKNPIFCNGEENEKVMRNPHADQDHHQKSTTSRGSSLARACQVWSTSVSAFVSYPVYRMTDQMTERSHYLHAVGAGNNILRIAASTYCGEPKEDEPKAGGC